MKKTLNLITKHSESASAQVEEIPAQTVDLIEKLVASVNEETMLWSCLEVDGTDPAPTSVVKTARKTRMDTLADSTGKSLFLSYVHYELIRKLYCEGVPVELLMQRFRLLCTEKQLVSCAQQLGWNVTKRERSRLRQESLQELIATAADHVTRKRIEKLIEDMDTLDDSTLKTDNPESYWRCQDMLSKICEKWGLNVVANTQAKKGTQINIGISLNPAGMSVDWSKARAVVDVEEINDAVVREQLEDKQLKQLTGFLASEDNQTN